MELKQLELFKHNRSIDLFICLFINISVFIADGVDGLLGQLCEGEQGGQGGWHPEVLQGKESHQEITFLAEIIAWGLVSSSCFAKKIEVFFAIEERKNNIWGIGTL